jgi:hypothetical protein
MNLFIEKKSTWDRFPVKYEILHETKKSVTIQALHASKAPERIKLSDFNARFKETSK